MDTSEVLTNKNFRVYFLRLVQVKKNCVYFVVKYRILERPKLVK